MRRGPAVCGIVLLTTSLLAGGCGPGAGKSEGGRRADEAATPPATAAHDHSGWWCVEHGVPEDVCGQCSQTVANDFREQGDWCRIHDRPDSQCFVCHPEHVQKFAALYAAKYGKPPPSRGDEPASAPPPH